MNPVPNGFIDLNVNTAGLTTKQVHTLLMELVSYDYRVIALNTVVDLETPPGSHPKTKKKKSTPPEDPVPAPTINKFGETISNKIKVVNRITVKYSEPGQIIKLKDSQNFKLYQLFAVQPTSSSAFTHACSTLEVDLISFSCEERLPYSIARKMYQVAVQKGIHFEVSYSNLIVSADARICCIQLCHMMSIYGKSKALVLSSGASHSMHVRTPHEVSHMALILGLSYVQAKQSIEAHPRSVLLRAYGRRLGKTMFNIVATEDAEKVDDTSLPPSLKKLKMEE